MTEGNIARLIRDLLKEIGENPDREGLKETPARVERFWREFIEYQPGNINTTFQEVTTDQMVVVSGIETWSLCEHHLLPFSLRITVGYIARERVIGLSKLARIAHKYSHALQIQERVCHQIADDIAIVTGSQDVAVYAEGLHLCMAMRGIKTPATAKTSVVRGIFKHVPEARAEFLRLALDL